MTAEDSPPAPRFARVGEACAMALLLALGASVPAAVRTASPSALLSSAAVLVVMLLPLAWCRPVALRGARGMGVRAALPWVAAWAGMSLGLVAGLGAALKALTHHRGLGGTTLGVVGAGLVFAAAIIVWRLRAAAEARPAGSLGRRGLAVGAAALALLPALLAFLPLFRGGAGGDAAVVRAAIFDVVVLLAALAWWLPRDLPAALSRPVQALAVPIAVAIVAVGGYRIERDRAAAAALRHAGGLAAAVLGGLEHWSDVDEDGHGAHFGGADCDEGDPTRHPGATDVADDGIDQDCDGRDGAGPTTASAKALPSAQARPPATSRPSATAAATAQATASAAASAPAAASGSAGAAPAPAARPALAAGKKPDVVLITLDTVRADRTTVYGYGKKTTPHLAKLAREGMVFEHAYAAATDTQHALMPVVSCRTLSDTPRSKSEWPTIEDDADTLAERLGRAGYATAGVASFTWLRKDKGFHQGFATFDESPFRENHPERKVTGVAAVKSALAIHAKLAKGDAPIFLWVHMFDAHARYLRHAGHDFGRDESGIYDGEIAFVDEQLGKLREGIAASGRGDRTAWVVHGSHGEAFGEHGKRGHGTELYDEVLRVPLVVAAPGAAVGRYTRDAVSVLDVAPTVLALAGAPTGDTSGLSLHDAVLGKPFERKPVFAHAWRRTAVIDWPLKLLTVRRARGKKRLLLFDLDADPKEERDVAGDRGAELRRLDALVEKDE